jgi:2-keto-4-pentenoate hydratase/2-oxohepta-3-ene-1,7-dioic acid hydratase in catechol pathway
MKLTMIESGRGPVPAVEIASGQLLDIAAAGSGSLLPGPTPRSLLEILSHGAPAAAALKQLLGEIGRDVDDWTARFQRANALHNTESVVFAPILQPGLILCGGMAYKEHMKEMNVGLPSAPTAFLRAPSSITSHRQPIVLPAQAPEMIDFECELSCVIGAPLYNLGPEEALRCVAGYTMVNDVGSRRQVPAWLASMGEGNPMKCVSLQNLALLDKQYPTFCPMGPFVVTADEFGDPGDATVETRLNGEVMQSAHTSDLIFTVAHSLAYFSRWYRFQPGDVFTTGSPSGVGFARKPPIFLQPGDVIEVSGSRIGTLSNPVVSEAAVRA